MWKQYIKAAWRNVINNKLFGILNIGGLAIGIAICVPLFIYALHELSFDNQYKQRDDIYRINLTTKAAYGVTSIDEHWSSIPNAVAPAALNEIPQIKYAARFFQDGFGQPTNLRIGERNFLETGLYWSDPEILKIFPTPFIKGDAATALTNPNSIVIAASEAQRLFGEVDAIGKIITVSSAVDGAHQLLVTGIFKDYPDNSSFSCKMIAPIGGTWAKNVHWSNASFTTYCLLNKNANKKEVESALNRMLINKVDSTDRWYSLFLQPLAKVHLHSATIRDLLETSGNGTTIQSIKNIGLLGLVIIIIACINYMNLSTARSEKHAKAVAINKTLGASRFQMIKRFYTETALMILIAIIIGYLLSFGGIHLFSYVTEKHLSYEWLFSFKVVVGLCCFWLMLTFIAGSYPALVLSSFSPLTLMRKGSGKSLVELFFRRGLVVLQFICSVVLIISVIVIAEQMKFVSQKNLGFTPHSVLAINISGLQNHQQYNALINGLNNIPEVQRTTVVQDVPGKSVSLNTLSANDGTTNSIPLYTCNAQNGVVETMGFKLLAGKDLPKEIEREDKNRYLVVNKKLIDFYGWSPEEAIGKEIQGWSEHTYITGVVADFNYASLHQPVGAYLYYESNFGGNPYNDVLVRFNTAHFSQTLQQIENTFKKNVPMAAFDYQLLDDVIAQLYKGDKVTARISLLFSVLAIFVSCLGLFGLTAYTAEKRRKEIGIRKVLGASVLNISNMLSKDFLQLVLISVIIAIPLAILLMNHWLSNFAYRIQISWLAISLAALFAILIAYVTVSLQAIKAAKQRPVNSLKAE